MSETVSARTVNHWKPNEVCANKHALHPSIFLYRISKISHYAYCYTVGLRQLSCLALMFAINLTGMTYDTVCVYHSW